MLSKNNFNNLVTTDQKLLFVHCSDCEMVLNLYIFINIHYMQWILVHCIFLNF